MHILRGSTTVLLLTAALTLTGTDAGPHRAALAQEDTPLAAGAILVASPHMRDPRFTETVILLLRHDRKGTTGLILNRPTGTRLTDLFSELAGEERGTEAVHFGGPVGAHQVLMLFRSKRPVRSAARVLGEVYVTSSERVMRAVVRRGRERGAFRVYAGYAGWTVGQLKRELRRGDWSVVAADDSVVFREGGAKLWQELFRRSSEIHVRNSGTVETVFTGHSMRIIALLARS